VLQAASVQPARVVPAAPIDVLADGGGALEEGEVSDDDEVVVVAQGGGASAPPSNPLRPVGVVPLVPAPSLDDEPDLQFALAHADESQDAWQARWLARQLDDSQLAPLRAAAEETARRRATGDHAVAERKEGEVRAEIGPDALLYVQLGDDEHWRLAVPNGCYTEVLRQMHAGVDGAHWSARRLLATLRRWFWWREMPSHAVAWCAQCVTCQRRRVLGESGVLGNSEESGEPVRLQSWQIDTLHVAGEHFLVAIELYSGYVVTAALVDQTSRAMSHAIELAVLQAFGVPRVLRCDGGSEFLGAVTSLCAVLGIEVQHGMVYNSRSQSRVERSLRTLRQIVTARQMDGSTEPMAVLLGRAARAINCAPSDDSYAISPYEYMHGAKPPASFAARFVDVDMAGLRASSRHASIREQLEGQERVHAQLARVRHEHHEQRRQKHGVDFARAHRADDAPVVGEWRWAVLPVDDVLAAKDVKARRVSGPWQVAAYDATHGRVDLVLVDEAPSGMPARVAVHARRTWPFARLVLPDDVNLLDTKFVPLDWESKPAPFGGLALLPEGAQAALKAAGKESARQAKLSAAARAAEEADERRLRDAERVVAEAAAKEMEQARAAEAARVGLEVVECLKLRPPDQVLVKRRSGVQEWLSRTDSAVPPRLLTELQARLRDERAAQSARRKEPVRLGGKGSRVTFASPLAEADDGTVVMG
jgi:hypothetical protein